MAYGFQGLKSLGIGGEQVQEPKMLLPVKQPAYDPAGYASFSKPSVSDSKGEMSQSPKDAVIEKYGYTTGQMPGINKDVAGVQGTAFNNWDETTKNEIRSSIAETSKPKAAKPSVKEEVRKAGYNPQESLGDLVATAIDNGGALSDEQIAQYFPEFKGKEKAVGDYFATLNEKPDLTPEETQQYFPEFFENVQDNVDSEYKYNVFDYVKRGAELLNKKAENIDIPVVEPIVQGVLGTAEFAAKGLRDITQAGASTLDRGIAAATGTEKVYDRSVAEDVFDAAQGTWNTALAVYAPLATTAFNSAMQAVPVEGQQKIGKVFNDVGSFVGKLTGVKQIKETLPPDRQQEFEQEVVGAMVGLIIGLKNKSNIYKNPLKFFSENLNPKALARNIQENVINIPARAIGSAKVGERAVSEIASKASSKVASKVASAPQKAYEATRKLAQGANEAYARKVTGLSQKAVDTFKSNPARRNVEAGQLTEDGLMKEVADTIASEKSRLDETGKAYEAVRNKDTVVKVGSQLPDITDKLSKYNISVGPDGKLNFSDAALESDAAGQKAIQFAYDVAKRGEIPADIFLNKRLDISNSIDWRSGVSDTANKITKEIRNSLNAAGHRDVAGLGALDETYGPQRKVWNQIAREFIDRETGTLKDSAKSKIMNMTNANKEALLAKIEQYFPDISLKVDALRTAREVDSLKGIKAGTYNKTALIAGGAKAGYELGQRIIPGGGLIGAPLGAIAGFIATDPAYIIKRLKGIEAKVPEDIMKKIELKQKLAKKEAGLVQKAISDAKKQSSDRQGLESKFKNYMETQGKEKPLALPEKTTNNRGTAKNPIVAKAPKTQLVEKNQLQSNEKGLPQKSVAKVAKKEKASTLDAVTPKKIEMANKETPVMLQEMNALEANDPRQELMNRILDNEATVRRVIEEADPGKNPQKRIDDFIERAKLGTAGTDDMVKNILKKLDDDMLSGKKKVKLAEKKAPVVEDTPTKSEYLGPKRTSIKGSERSNFAEYKADAIEFLGDDLKKEVSTYLDNLSRITEGRTPDGVADHINSLSNSNSKYYNRVIRVLKEYGIGGDSNNQQVYNALKKYESFAKTKSAKIDTPIKSLEAEARKYKSAEEFVDKNIQNKSKVEITNNDGINNEKIVLYHGTNNEFDNFDKNYFGKGEGSNKLGKGVYLTTNKNKAGEYGTNIVNVDANGVKIIDRDAIKHQDGFGDFIDNSDVKKEHELNRSTSGNKGMDWKEAFARKGFDGIMYADGEVMIFDTDKLTIKSKSQLRKIREEANSKGLPIKDKKSTGLKQKTWLKSKG